jgi:uncharacterized glyoxalase superfamily protein PhnB
MTARKDFKRLVRERAQRTGESYSSALRHLRNRTGDGHVSSDEQEEPTVTITRAIPDIRSSDLDGTRDFYAGLLGFDVCMEERGMLMFCSPSNPKVQVSVNGDGVPLPPGFAVDVGTAERVTHLHDDAVERALTIVEPLDDKPWGIRRFSVLDPNGTRVTVLAHLSP